MADGQTYFIILLILSIGFNAAFPAQTALHPQYTYLGMAFIGFGMAIALWSRSLFLKSSTTLSPYETPASLVTSGPFGISRNPMYLGMASVLIGTAVLTGTLAAFAFPILFMAIIEALLIPGEERKLERIFGERYRKYKNKVRRWI